jgi:deoxyribonuclease V
MNKARMEPKFSVEKAHKAQLRLSEKIVFEDKLPKKVRSVAGVDVAYGKGVSVGAVTVLDYDSFNLTESQTAICKTRFPYIPTLLSFREIPPSVSCIKKLHTTPDVFLVDGHGFAHPYECGFASHLGLAIRKPTIGVAKDRLFGEVENVKTEENFAFLKHNDRIIGAVVTTKGGCKPVYVSVGHMISLETAIKIVKHCARHNRIPEPIWKAHEIANVVKRKINNTSTTIR